MRRDRAESATTSGRTGSRQPGGVRLRINSRTRFFDSFEQVGGNFEQSGRSRAKSLSRDIVSQATDNLWLVYAFIVSLFIPWTPMIGTFTLSAYRFVLLVAVLKCLVKWANGAAGPIRGADIFLISFSIWGATTLIAAHGIDYGIKSGGIMFVETVGPYLLARCYIRDFDDFRKMVQLTAAVIIVLMPFAIYETLTGHKLILEAFRAVGPTFVYGESEMRMGLRRVQGPFEHPILFGVFCGSLFALTHFLSGEHGNAALQKLRTMLVVATAMMCLSSAPIAGLVLQGAFMSWDWILRSYKSRWAALLAMVFVAYLVIEFGSNQTPIQFYISHFTFDQVTGWYRIWIWNYGSASVLNHPLFGIGLSDWARPSWMVSGSIDNFWLVIAVRHGFPGLFLLLAACLSIAVGVGLKKGLDRKAARCRTAYIICMVAYFIVGTTVHFWGATYAWFMFLLGSGVWMLDVRTTDVRSRHARKELFLTGGRYRVARSGAAES